MDKDVLTALYNATNGPEWANSTNWLTNAPIGDWYGVTTDADGRVVELSLKENGLAGRIPTSLDGLTRLESLDLSWNGMIGTIPPEVGNLSRLQDLRLGANRLSGEIPPELGNLKNLRELQLGNGLKLFGEIPLELSRLTQLEVLDLGQSNIGGPVPAWLGELSRLRKLHLDDNLFSGEVPSELGKLTSLQLLTLEGNAALLGALPQALTAAQDFYRLTFYNTGLCAPAGGNFQSWLRNISDRRGPDCLPEQSDAASADKQVIVRDMFGRIVNETGIVIVDWEGHIANPAPKYYVDLPGRAATLSSSEPRLYFDLPSSTGLNGPTKGLSSDNSGKAPWFRISIYPDRDTSDERHTLTIQYTVGGGQVHSESIDIHVIDQDVHKSLEFSIFPDYSQDKTGMFDNPSAKEAVQRAADDFAYFIADMNLDEVRAGEEVMWIWNDGDVGGGFRVRNDITYTGFLMHVYGRQKDDLTAGGGPSNDGRNQSSDGVELSMKRSGSILFEPRGNYNTLGWMTSVHEGDWWRATNFGEVPNDLYSIALHEMGHALLFNDGHDGFAGFSEAKEIRDPAVEAYFGSYPSVNPYDHLLGVDPASRRGVYGNEYNGETPDGRWIVTKLDLLVAQAVGYVLRDTSPFRPLSVPEEPLMPGRWGEAYTHTLAVVGGVPAYYWTIDSGVLPEGLSLNSFTGTISGTAAEDGTFTFAVRVRDSTEGSDGVSRDATLYIRR